jgi:hypothetical protein
MDRIALSKRLEGLSRVFVAGSPYRRDLKAMAEVLAKVDDEKFATILDAEFTADKEGAGVLPMTSVTPQHPGIPQRPFSGRPSGGKGILTDDKLRAMARVLSPEQISKVREILEPEMMPGLETRQPIKPPVGVTPVQGLTKSADESDKDVGLFWNKEATEAIQNNLLRDVVGMDKKQIQDTGRHLTPDQVPNGTHDGEKAKNLKPEQTPELRDVLKSDIYAKSKKTPLKKEAGYEEEEDKKDDKKDDKSAGKKELSPSEQAALAKAKEQVAKGSKGTEKGLKVVERLTPEDEPKTKTEKPETKKPEKDAPKPKKDAPRPEDDKEANLAEGIELTAPMEDVILDAAEQEKLSKLFA